ncbi:hypothetical protein QCA50_006147 [Cerrena zonata]|uniref:Uncharacterized protein n=1 Tax=Cerrena zonata TaxID=2478898 RepID=A0AAW0GN83_9APHY
MARAYGRKIMCAYADPAPKPKRVTAPRPKLTDAEKAAKKAETAARAETRKKVKSWEEGLKEWTGGDGYRGIRYVDGTKVLFKSDAKSQFKLSDKDIASLPFYGFPNSRKRVFALTQLETYAKRKFEATGIEYPAIYSLPPYMVLHGPNVKGLTHHEYEHERVMNLVKLMKRAEGAQA